ncbi:ubiquitin-like domain-containing CTD phosphatase 1 [Rhopilema esculentum]|uniref:ubiquitin-like domain-containing CTD phosphatase 1 n=1 Tax=Rhopilema esculentum TaxID=499914 RepID=UPI0031CF5511
MASKPGESINLVIKWSGKEYNIDNISSSNTVADLKQAIKDRTCVLPERQKLLGLKYKGKPPGNDVKLGALSVKPGMKIMMMGTAEENLETIIKPPEDVIKLKIKEDEDIGDEEVALENREEFLAKVQRRVASYQIKVLNEPRPGKKLLVLDVDYTLFDHKSVAETGFDLMRPYLHEFLTSAYDCYDIVIWSATSMKWIEAKMQELGVTNNPNYKIMFMLDSDAMITVQSPTYGIIETKPLGVIWGKYAQYSSKNSIIIDDLRRNFLMNPSNGLKIRPFRNAHASRATDQELLRISKYLKKIATLEDFAKLDHRNWESYIHH